jgi:hypothetical protein
MIKAHILSLFCLLLLVACDSDKAVKTQNSIIGKYVNQAQPANSIQLKDDKTFTLIKHGKVIQGDYRFDENKLALLVPVKDIAFINNQIITDSGGDTWRQKTSDTYVSEVSQADSIILREDGSFTIEKEGDKLNGQYAIASDQLTLTVIVPNVFKRQANAIVDTKDVQWLLSNKEG